MCDFLKEETVCPKLSVSIAGWDPIEKWDAGGGSVRTLLGLVYDGFWVEFSALFTPFSTNKEKSKARIWQSL